jgi:RimJ/RimL family protein N-acetyltransferase
MNILGKKVYLRAMEPEDMEAFRSMINDPDTEYMLGGWSYPVSTRQQMDWYENAIKGRNDLRWAVADIENNQLLGMVNLVDIDWKNGTAMHGIRLLQGEQYRGHGYGTDAVETLMRYAFEELRLNRLETTILEYNDISKALYRKCGWVKEGVKRESVFRKGQFYNQQLWGIISSDYYKDR